MGMRSEADYVDSSGILRVGHSLADPAGHQFVAVTTNLACSSLRGKRVNRPAPSSVTAPTAANLNLAVTNSALVTAHW